MSGVVAERYARALHALAHEQGVTAAMDSALRELAETWEASKDLQSLFQNPVYGADARSSVIQRIVEKLGAPAVLGNALRLLSDRKRMGCLPAIAKAFSQIRGQAEGVVQADIYTAAPLNEAYCRELTDVLQRVTGKKVSIVQHEDRSLMAGVIAKVGGQIFDGSLSHRLAQMRQALGAQG